MPLFLTLATLHVKLLFLLFDCRSILLNWFFIVSTVDFVVMADPRLKTLRIKTGVVKRLAKEKVSYEKEADSQRAYIQKIKDQGKDEHDIRKQEEVLQESVMMVPDCQRRLVKAYDELKGILDTESDLIESEEYKAAKQILTEAALQLPTSGTPSH